ncbi:NH(3)-dependent NAD(+) synthetase [Natrialba taiwanensis DSM 12281]|uniref:NH(3)-dependent NAD(+) synthetase n=2 Tax=Natrialba taiwanensis TaxID=160846 RepID=L9ZIA8_9EURY|nr:NH(3)-dependent NAD(+) synthetase [Natrialba taiwanensis DSM 12281]
MFLEEQVERPTSTNSSLRSTVAWSQTVVGALAADAVGSDRVTGLVMPVRLNNEASARDAEAVTSILDIDYQRMQLQLLLTVFQDVISMTGQPVDDLVAIHNTGERLKKTCQYYVANTTNWLVVGTVNRTDRLLRSMVKHGENGVDLLPLGDLYRAGVEELASGLEVPEGILDRPQQTVQSGESAVERLGRTPKARQSPLPRSQRGTQRRDRRRPPRCQQGGRTADQTVGHRYSP